MFKKNICLFFGYFLVITRKVFSHFDIINWNFYLLNLWHSILQISNLVEEVVRAALGSVTTFPTTCTHAIVRARMQHSPASVASVNARETRDARARHAARWPTLTRHARSLQGVQPLLRTPPMPGLRPPRSHPLTVTIPPNSSSANLHRKPLCHQNPNPLVLV